MNQSFDQWHKTHGCDTESLWLIQNCLGSLYGFDHPDAKAASKAWEESRKDPKSCRHLFERGKCIRCDTEEKGECRYDCKSHPEEKPCAECKKANQGGEKDLEICFECGGVKFIGRFCECEAKECINAPQRCLIGFWCKWCKENRPDAHLNQEASERNMRAIAESFEDAKPQKPSEEENRFTVKWTYEPPPSPLEEFIKKHDEEEGEWKMRIEERLSALENGR